MTNKFIGLLVGLTMLAGCNETGDDPASEGESRTITPNVLPTISVANTTGTEKATLLLQAEASDSDGQVQSIDWTQTSGPEATMTINDLDLSLVLPEVLTPTELTFMAKVTDDDGDSAETSFSVMVEPILTNVTISGLAATSEAILRGMPVVVTIGQQQWLTQTNELGRYYLEMAVDDSEIDSLVTIVATGNAVNSIVKFVSIAPSVNEMLATVSDSEVAIDESDVDALSITAKSTAQAIFVSEMGEITSYSDFVTNTESINMTSYIETWFTLEQIYQRLDDDDFLAAIPSDFGNTFDTLLEASSRNTIVAKIKAELGSAWQYRFNDFIEELPSVQISDLTLPTNAILTSSFDQLSSGDRVSFSSDNAGQWQGRYVGEFAWEQNTNALELTFNNTNNGYYDYESNSFYYSRFVRKVSLKPIFSHDKEILFLMTQYYSYESDESYVESDPSLVTLTSIDQLISPQTIIDLPGPMAFVFENVINGEITNSINEVVSIESARKHIEFLTNESSDTSGTANITMLNVVNNASVESVSAGTWSIDADKLQLSFNGMSVEVAIYAYNETKGTYNISVTSIDGSDPTNTLWDNGYIFVEQAAFNVDEEYLSGKIFSFNSPLDTHLKARAWYEFNNDGTMNYIYAFDSDQDGELHVESYSNADYLYISSGLWRVVDGKLEVLRHRQNNEYGYKSICLSGTWQPLLDDECVAYVRLDWQFNGSAEASEVLMFTTSTYYQDPYLDPSQRDEASPFIIRSQWSDAYSLYVLDERPITLPDDAFTDPDKVAFSTPVLQPKTPLRHELPANR